MNADPHSREWALLYGAALSRHLQQGHRKTMAPAKSLGRKAVALKLETLDVARIHEQALHELIPETASSRIKARSIQQATSFFAEAIVPIEKTRQAAIKTDLRIVNLTRELRRRTVELAASARALKQGIDRRQLAEAALSAQGKKLALLLRESNTLQKKLSAESRRALSGQEAERIKMSCRLHEDIVQALVAIKLRLVTLGKRTTANMASLKKEVAETERLVKHSVKSIQRLTHEINGCHES